MQRALVATEFSLALTLLAGGGLAIHSLMNLSRVDLGFPTERLLTFSLSPASRRLPDASSILRFYDQLHEKIGALPGVQSVSFATGGPLAGGFGMAFNITGQPRIEGSGRPSTGFVMASSAYFKTYGLRIIK